MRTRAWVVAFSLGIAVLALVVAWRERLSHAGHTALNPHSIPATSNLAREHTGGFRNPLLTNLVAPSRPLPNLNRIATIDADVGAKTLPEKSDRKSNLASTSNGADFGNAPVDTSDSPKAQRMIPNYWRLTNDGFSFITESQEVHSGSYGAVLSSNQDAGSESVFQSCSAAGFRGKRAQFSIFLMGGDEFGDAEVWVRIDDPTQPVQVVRVPANLQSGADWQLVKADIPVTLHATVLTYGVILNGRGPLWMDTAALGIVGTSGTVVDFVANDENSKPSVLASGLAPRFAENMDFEEFHVTQ